VGATSNAEILGTQQERRHTLVHRNAANTVPKYMTQDAHLKIVRKTGSSKKTKQHAVGCEYIHIEANGGQLAVSRTPGVRRELHKEFIAAHNGKRPWLRKAFCCIVHEIAHHDVVSSGIFADQFPNHRPHEWTKQGLITFEEATEAYMVEVTAEFHC